MERFELAAELLDEFRSRTFDGKFIKLVQSVRRNGRTFRISLRPVEIGGERRFQAEMNDNGTLQVKNLNEEAARQGLEEILFQRGARELHLITAIGDVHVRVTRKGKVQVSRSVAMDRKVELRPHDRVKNTPLNAFESAALLRTIGLTDGEGKVRASMRGKYDQVNEFLKVVGETVPDAADRPNEFPLTVVDCGCGKAYLTMAMYFYLTEVKHYSEVRIIGIDRRHDVVSAAREMAKRLDVAEKVIFVEADLSEFELTSLDIVPRRKTGQQVDLVCSLHACDTATDEALARGVEWKARWILSAPCCQHELQKELGSATAALLPGHGHEFTGLLRQSILRERLCDLLTDAFRAMILRILGFKVQVVEFVSSEATARNVMLRCEYTVKPGQIGPIGEYLELRDYWHVKPFLGERLSEYLRPHLERYA